MYQTNIVHSDKATAQPFRMKSMVEFRNLREQILTVHLFDVGLETVQNRKAEESDVVMRVSASQVNAYYQFSREERPIHFGLVERCGTEQPHCVVAHIKVPLYVQPTSERLEAKEERDTMQYEHGINVSRAMNENESDADEHDEVKCGPFSSTYTVISSEKNRRIVNAGTKAEMDAFANHSMQNSHVTISLDIARVKLLVTDQYFLNDIYNCVLNDLLMFVPSVLAPIESSMYQFDSANKCFVAPSLSQLIEADMDTDFFASNSINLHG
ncbi:autophagy-related protein -like, partial [Brachionus plicatilis]